MTIFGQFMGILIGFVFVIKAGGHLDQMSRSTDHLIRIGYFLLCVGGAALIIGPFAFEHWITELGWLLIGIGACIFMLYGRRAQESDKKNHDATH